MEERRARARIQQTQDTRSKTHEGKNPPSGAKAGVCRNAPVFPVKAATAPTTHHPSQEGLFNPLAMSVAPAKVVSP